MEMSLVKVEYVRGEAYGVIDTGSMAREDVRCWCKGVASGVVCAFVWGECE